MALLVMFDTFRSDHKTLWLIQTGNWRDKTEHYGCCLSSMNCYCMQQSEAMLIGIGTDNMCVTVL